MNKYVEREVELLHQPALAEDVNQVGHQVELPLAVDLVQHGGHRHVRQAVAGQGKLAEYNFFYPKHHQENTINVKKD